MQVKWINWAAKRKEHSDDEDLMKSRKLVVIEYCSVRKECAEIFGKTMKKDR